MPRSSVIELCEHRKGDAGDAIADFVRDHPGMVVAGGVAAGLLAGALLPRCCRAAAGANSRAGR